MRTEQKILDELKKAREEYHVASDTEPAAKLTQRSDKIKALMQELSDTLSHGAKELKGEKPYGRLRTPAHKNKGKTVFAVYEVGAGGKRSVGPTAALAVEAWNAGQYE